MAEKRIFVLSSRYHLDFFERLGKGAFGVVYKGVDIQDKIPVAVKEISVKQERIAAMCMDEIKALEAVPPHDNVVNLKANFFRRTAFWLVMDFCDMGDLEGYFKKYRPLMNTRIEFMSQVASGIAFMHGLKRKMIHRDIKPQNILVTYGPSRPTVKITDFGLAKVQEETTGTCLGQSFVMQTQAGTPCFMAPEMFEHRDYGLPVDVFAMGLMFLGMIDYDKRKMLFPLAEGGLFGPIGQAMMMAKKFGQEMPKFSSPSSGDTKASKRVRETVDRMICYNPKERIKSKEVHEQMDGIFATVLHELPDPPARPPVKIPPTLEEAMKHPPPARHRQGQRRERAAPPEAGIGYRLLRDALAQLVEEDVGKKDEKVEGHMLQDMPLGAALQQMQRRLFDGDEQKEDDGKTLPVGGKVRVCADKAECEELQAGYGEWTDDMANCLGKTGKVVETVVHMVRVEFSDGRRYLWNPALLTPVDDQGNEVKKKAGTEPTTEPARATTKFRRFDIVRLPGREQEAEAKRLQEGHGGWNDSMRLTLGITGVVSYIDRDGDLKISAINGHRWLWNPTLMTKVERSAEEEDNLESGDMVLIKRSGEEVRGYQMDAGLWDDAQKKTLGHVGVIRNVRDDGLEIEVDKRKHKFHPLCCKLIAKSEDVLAAFYRKKFGEDRR